jgi:hypothetical protein
MRARLYPISAQIRELSYSSSLDHLAPVQEKLELRLRLANLCGAPLTLAPAIRRGASRPFPEISWDRQARPRADERLREREKWYGRQATPRFRRGYGTKRRSAGVEYVRMILSATTERAGAFGGAIEEVASCYTESGRLQA